MLRAFSCGKTLTLARVAWCAEAELQLARAVRCFPACTVADYRRLVLCDRDTHLVRVDCADGLVGFVVLRIERYSGGNEGVILAAAGRLRGIDLTLQLLPHLEKLFTGVAYFRIATARPGLVKKLRRAGYGITHFVLRKPAHAVSA